MITLDSASNNNTAMEELEELFIEELMDLLNGIPELTVIFSADESAAELKEYAEALQSDPVGKSRQIVAACRASGQRRADVKQIIVDGNRKFLWQPGGTLRVVQLLRDCETRWSSTYLMSDRLLELYPAVQCFLNHPQQTQIAHLLFTTPQYQLLHDIQTILAVPHAAQELLSAEKTPTLSAALPAFEILLESWIDLQTKLPMLSHYIGVGIVKIQEYAAKGRKTRAYALAMSIVILCGVTFIS
ncbi:hypothetical protein DFH07DRAFT_867753 [Mycena maculata]|uniref:Uncharacterized protein n=1 Tax=Mycena maculata TaxID=230809 RepID=A0AAD7JBZ1_9AGAR|nr:hypothetical protein DFH07DRAFT_1007412 [Mycena maculata]KAJ7744765.1 hypothetical protein DFH07DRAFT_869756 [Mycena maculata]KAJ7761210.1 hypothetical protein DFH07DRAFT_867753 [Mycena maculata]